VHLPPPSGSFPVRFDRFSPYHSAAREHGLELRPCDFYEMVYPWSREDLAAMCYFFVDQRFDADYRRNTAKWLGRLRQGIDHWRTRWEQRDGRLKPELSIRQRGGERVVYDSRSGSAVEHRVGAVGLRLLEALGQQQRPAQLQERLAPVPAAEIERALAALAERGLLFEENGMLMSLVVDDPSELPIAPPAAAVLELRA